MQSEDLMTALERLSKAINKKVPKPEAIAVFQTENGSLEAYTVDAKLLAQAIEIASEMENSPLFKTDSSSWNSFDPSEKSTICSICGHHVCVCEQKKFSSGTKF